MPEELSLQTPVGQTTTRWLIRSLTLQRGWDPLTSEIDPTSSFIEVLMVGDNGQFKNHRWNGVVADGLIVALNKANLTTNTLYQRVMTRLIADGICQGTIAGEVD